MKNIKSTWFLKRRDYNVERKVWLPGSKRKAFRRDYAAIGLGPAGRNAEKKINVTYVDMYLTQRPSPKLKKTTLKLSNKLT